MKFKDGMNVEVCSFEAGFEGAWFECIIMSCEEGSYKVLYDKFETDDGEPLVESLDCSRIRPCPPHINIKNWAIGDGVEAYETDCWWRGFVSQVLPGKQYSVYFPDSNSENTYHRSSLRSRQDWHDGKWYGVPLPLQARSRNIVRVKLPVVSNSRETPLASSSKGPNTGAPSQSMCLKVTRNVEPKPGFNMQVRNFSRNFSKSSQEFNDKRRLRAEAQIPSSRSQKSLKLSNAKKENLGCCKPLVGGNVLDSALPLYRGSDLLSFDNKTLKRGHTLKKRTEMIDEDFPYEETYKLTKSRRSVLAQATCQTHIEITKNVGNSFEPHVESILFGGSIMGMDNKKCSPSTDGSCIAFVHSSRDRKTATMYWSAHDNNQKNNGVDIEDENKLTMHKLEANAYRSVLQAFHAQGSLSWEREALLTNLRLKLHITCEEHRLELEKLVSAHPLKI